MGNQHFAALSQDGELFMWGRNKQQMAVDATRANGLGRVPVCVSIFPARVLVGRVRIGRCLREVDPVDALALAMGAHLLLGANSPLSDVTSELLCKIVTATSKWPECAATRLPGPARLLGGGFMRQCPARAPADA